MRRDGFRIVFYSYCFRNILVSCETVSISNGPYVYVSVCVCVCVCMCMCVRAGVRVRVVVYVCIPNRFKASANLSHNPYIFVISHIDDWNWICCPFIILCIALFQALRTYCRLGSLRVRGSLANDALVTSYLPLAHHWQAVALVCERQRRPANDAQAQ